jgi:hypothetical protein
MKPVRLRLNARIVPFCEQLGARNLGVAMFLGMCRQTVT